MRRIPSLWNRLSGGLRPRQLLPLLLGAVICSFGIHNIHERCGITEGGIIGLMLLLEHWLHVSPAYLTPVLDAICYLLAFRFLGGRFIRLSLLATVMISGCYKLWELFPPLLPDLSGQPLAAAIAGGLFVGLGVGLIVRQGGSSGGDDALALVLSHALRWKLSRAYLFTDITVLLLSLTYIPLNRIFFSLITVTVSSHLIDWVKGYRPAAKQAAHGGEATAPPSVRANAAE